MGDRFQGLVRLVTRRPLAVLAVVGVLALVGAALALRLDPSTSTDTLVDSSSESFQATERFKRDFGDDAVIVLVKGDLERTLLTADLGRLLRLEGCLSGNVPAKGLRELPPACREIAKLKPAQVVYGPATFLNTAATQIAEEFLGARQNTTVQAKRAAESARKLSARRGDPPAEQRRLAKIASDAVYEKFQSDTLQLALRYGLSDIPSIDSPGFVSSVVFTTGQGKAGIPKSRFAYLFPSENAALIQVRLRPGLSDSERQRAIQLIRDVTSERVLQPTRGARYVVTGVPVVSEGLASAVESSIYWLLGAALLVMAATLALVFRTRLRLLPLGLALAAAALTFGGLSLTGGSLTMASIAVLPVLIGLAVDYAIQFHARFDEERSRRRDRSAADSAVAAAGAGGPTIATAGLATAVGFLVLLLSPVPMVRGFGVLLVLGIALALGCALTAGFASLAHFTEPGPRPADLPPAFPRLTRFAEERVQAARESRPAEWVRDRALGLLDYALTKPAKVLGVGLAVAVVGWAVDTQTEVVSDVRELVPQDLQALRDVNELQRETGVSGEIDVTVRSDDIARPEVIAWMSRFQARVLKEHGWGTGDSCSQKDPPELCPALSLPDLFSSSGAPRTRADISGLLDAVPAYFSQAVVSRDRRTANLAFGIRLMPLDRQKEVVEDIEAALDPPEGVSAAVVGLPVLAAEANGALTSPWRRVGILLAALAAVFLVLLGVRRSRRWAAVPLIPIALATGWTGAVLFILGLLPGPLEVDLNPMSVTLGALVIAISTEFSVLLSSRYRQEREAGAGPVRAIELTYASTGAAVLASGATAIAGFAVLIVSDIRMLRDFGIVTVVDLTVSLLGVMLVLPAALLWAEEHGPFTLRDLNPRKWAGAARSALPRLRPRSEP